MEEKGKLHIVMLPWLAMGHMIPFLELSKCLAQKGHRISFLSTHKNLQKLPKIPISFVEISLPHVENLPEGAESTNDLPPHKVHYLKKAFDESQNSIAVLLQDLVPDWIIYDFASHWIPPYAAKLGVSCAFFSLFNAAAVCYFGPTSALMSQDEHTIKPREDLTLVPEWLNFPTNNLCLRLYEALRVLDSMKENVAEVSDGYRYGAAVKGSDVVFIRSCIEFEPFWLEFAEKEILQKPVIPVGLLPPSSGEDELGEWADIKEWLDTQTTASVVYIALGTEVILTQKEVTEIACGLELSELPFFWVLRKQSSSATTDSYVLPSGFEVRTKGRGIVCTSWVPQLKMLAHPSVGGFLTHCGWNSVIEALSFGHPLVLLPLLAEQGLNARVLHEEKIGLEIPRDRVDGSFTRDVVAETLRMVMVDEEGAAIRKKAKEMREIFGMKELHYQYVEKFIQYLQDHKQSESNKVL